MMSVVDMHMKLFGFKPDRVYLDVNYVTRKITITSDYSELALREQPYHQPGWQEPIRAVKHKGRVKRPLSHGWPARDSASRAPLRAFFPARTSPSPLAPHRQQPSQQ
ncbi:hypothetical protein [Burkholderia multivorans]|uniref:hypothetical protein n=1 Tax=Burkholderia multivorans TaxID=87883 RepID=UPI0020B36829|nr:hypothetical protein [Burkholderia multivorans]